MAASPRAGAVDKRRLILDAAIRVFARQGFHACRVSDIADEAGVAYGLVYHYFGSKDEVLDTLFLERWGILLDAIRQVDQRRLPAREKLHAISRFGVCLDCRSREDPIRTSESYPLPIRVNINGKEMKITPAETPQTLDFAEEIKTFDVNRNFYIETERDK